MSDEIEKIDLSNVDWRSSREFFESLHEELEKLDDKDEKYDFTWVGKRRSIIEAGSPINKIFKPAPEESKNWDSTENLFIEGDNLEALKLLQESYLGKVKMIYIDPPYNTGKDFVYHDNFKQSVAEFDDATDYKDEDGKIQFKKNEKSNGRYHSDWLSMMYPRLKLARNLLSEDGVIFISIDDNEQANLKKLCDEVFGEECLIQVFVWQKKTQPSFLSKEVAEVTESVIAYKKNTNQRPLKGGETDIDRSSEMINIGNPVGERVLAKDNVVIENGIFTGRIKAGLYGNGLLAVNLLEDITVENGVSRSDIRIRGRIVQSQSSLDAGMKEGWQISIKSTKSFRPTLDKKRQIAGIKPPISLLSKKIDPRIPTNTNASSEIKELFNGINIMDYPKPTKLIAYLVNAVLYDRNSGVILDFFAGSSTTAHAVMQLNAEDGGNRKFIMVQLPEECPPESEAAKAGYKTIPEISKERIRRAGAKIAAEHPDAKVDYGFRVLKVAEANEKDVYKQAGDINQADLLSLVENIHEGRSDLDLLYGVITNLGMELTSKIEQREVDGKQVYLYGYDTESDGGIGLIACFESDVTDAVVSEIIKLKPLVAVFRDSGFKDSAHRVNVAEQFRVRGGNNIKLKVI